MEKKAQKFSTSQRKKRGYKRPYESECNLVGGENLKVQDKLRKQIEFYLGDANL